MGKDLDISFAETKNSTISAREYSHDDSELSTDTNILVQELRELTQISKNAFWLIGQRAWKLREKYDKGQLIDPSHNPVSNWKEFCNEFLDYKHAMVTQLIKLSRNVLYTDLEMLPMDISKQLLIGDIADSETRKDVIKQVSELEDKKISVSNLKKMIRETEVPISTVIKGPDPEKLKKLNKKPIIQTSNLYQLVIDLKDFLAKPEGLPDVFRVIDNIKTELSTLESSLRKHAGSAES